MSEELFFEKQRRIEAELRAAILRAGEQDITIARLREELEQERENLKHEKRLAGHLATEMGRRDCEIERLRGAMGEIVLAFDQGRVYEVREIALHTLEVAG